MIRNKQHIQQKNQPKEEKIRWDINSTLYKKLCLSFYFDLYFGIYLCTKGEAFFLLFCFVSPFFSSALVSEQFDRS